MTYTASSKRLLLGRLAGGAPPSSPPRSTAVATEAAGAPAARFLPLPLSSLGQLVQPLKKEYIKNLAAVTLPYLNVALKDSAIRQVTLRAPPGGSRVSPPGRPGPHMLAPGQAAHKMASPAMYTCSLFRKAALRSEAEMASMMTAHVSCGRVSQAPLAILVPERQRFADSGVS
jgi:hypothetical protein